ncbi:unnamed protein product [Effrenium voratum]|uniref:TerD domain-containing protein n=1 Tax=Effrenium voratum TaxID=2562239 RepID=A0AA36I271_9DINO|nr:unnamed protein product [Effrenium voratum]
MEKGGVLDMPLGMNSITVGLGWGVDEGEVDLDVSAVLLDQRGSVLEAVFFGHLESAEHGIVHSGDNLTGEGEGDDEQIRVDLLHVGLVAQQVFFVVNIYSQNKTFRQVASPYCRIVEDASGSELCRYSLSDAGSDNGLLHQHFIPRASQAMVAANLHIAQSSTLQKLLLPDHRQDGPGGWRALGLPRVGSPLPGANLQGLLTADPGGSPGWLWTGRDGSKLVP